MILYSRWQALNITTRMKIAEAFGIIKKGSTQVDSNVLKHDGYDIADIEKALTLEAMQKFLNCQNDDMGFVFNLIIDKVEGRDLVGLIPVDELKPGLLGQMTPLPPEEVKQFKKEYKERKTLNASIKKVKRNNAKTKN